jgi:hypothetical protein
LRGDSLLDCCRLLEVFLSFFCVLRRGTKEKVCVAVAARDKQRDAGADDVTATTWRSMIGNWHGTYW